MKKARRYIAARMLHLGCNAIDSARVTQWFHALDYQDLTVQERKLVTQRMRVVKEMVEDVRKIANHIERTAK